jgi:site-specific DNA-methyltransferase (adenine-specific)
MLHCGDAYEVLKTLRSESVRMFLTSPPYFCKFDYGVEGQCGLENSLDEYIAYHEVVAEQMLRVATRDANLFYVIQDTFNGSGGTGGDFLGEDGYRVQTVRGPREKSWPRKAQLLIPERIRIAFAQIGWVPILRIMWDKSDPRRAARDRPSYSYEEILAFNREDNGLYEEIMLFSANPIHYFNRNAVLAPFAESTKAQLDTNYTGQSQHDHSKDGTEDPSDTKRRIIKSMNGREGAYLRAVWRIPSGNQPVIEHNGIITKGIASFPSLLAEIAVNLGSAPGDTVCDPFSGLGTTMLAALKWGRNAIGIELNPMFCSATRHRIAKAGY